MDFSAGVKSSSWTETKISSGLDELNDLPLMWKYL